MSGVHGRVLHMTEQMKRKDGRELVTEFPVTAMDEIEYIGHVKIPADAIVCGRRREPQDDWMNDDIDPFPEDFGIR